MTAREGSLLGKTLSYELQGVRDPGSPVSPVMPSVPHPEFMGYLLFYQGEMKHAVSPCQEIIIPAIYPVPDFFEIIRGFVLHNF